MGWLEAVHWEARGVPAWASLQLLAMAVGLGWFIARTRAQPSLRACLVAGFVGAVVGGLALGLALALPAWVASGFELRALRRAGVVAYGALGGLVLVYVMLARRRGVRAGAALDRLAPILGVLVVFGRAGCYLGGCDHGTVTALPWGVRFARRTAAWSEHLRAGLIGPFDDASLAVHPSQLYEALLGALMIVMVLVLERGRGASGARRPGVVFALTAALYAAGRIGVEVTRGYGVGLPISSAQILGGLVLVGAAGWAWRAWTVSAPAPPLRSGAGI